MKFPWTKNYQYKLRIRSDLNIQFAGTDFTRRIGRQITYTDVVAGVTSAMYNDRALSDELRPIFLEKAGEANHWYDFSEWFFNGDANSIWTFSSEEADVRLGGVKWSSILTYEITHSYDIIRIDPLPEAFTFDIDVGGMLKTN